MGTLPTDAIRRLVELIKEDTHSWLEVSAQEYSQNKTRLGELVLTPRKPEILQDGDVVSFGSVKVTFRLLGASELPEPWSPL